MFLVDIIFYWGFSIRTIGSSAASLSYLIPPPQTLIGALSWSLTRALGFPEVVNNASATKLFIDRSIVLWSSAKINGLAMPYSDLVKLERSPYQRESYRVEEARQFGVSSMGRIYAPGLKATIAYVIDVEKLSVLLRDLGMNVDPLELLKLATYSIIRVGSKESIVTVTNVKIVDPRDVYDNVVETSFYVPRICATNVKGVYETVAVPSYSDEHYAIHGSIELSEVVHIFVPMERRFTPITFGGKLQVEVQRDRCVVRSVDGDILIYPKDGIKELRE